ncbi:hypothetical protein BH20VER3_BH20VER3_08750 [soil metagenome]
MAWVVNSNILFDVALDDPSFRVRSVNLLRKRRPRGLVVSPVTIIELAPSFDGDFAAVHTFLAALDVRSDETWTETDTANGCAAWSRYISQRRALQGTRRPIADVLIGSFSERFEGLLTRNTADFRTLFPALKIEAP